MKRIVALINALLLVILCGCSGDKKTLTPIYGVKSAVITGALSGTDTVEVAANANYSLSVVPDTGYFELKALNDGYIYASSPMKKIANKQINEADGNAFMSALLITYGDKINRISANVQSYPDSVLQNGCKTSAIQNGFISYYTFQAAGITVPLKIELTDEGITASVEVLEIKENSNYLVTEIDILPYFSCGGWSDDGYTVVPDGSGAIINFSNGKHSYPSLNLEIYGNDAACSEQSAEQMSGFMPIYGIKNGNHAVLSVIEKGDAHALVKNAIAGGENKFNAVWSSFTVRDSAVVGVTTNSVGYSNKNFILFDETEQTLDEITVNYIALTGDNANYTGMAKRYSQYIKTDSSEQYSELALKITCAVKKQQTLLGVKSEKTVVISSASEIISYLERLKNTGLDKISLYLKNWSESETEETSDKRYTPLKAAGGKKGFRELLQFGNENNTEIYGAYDPYTVSTAGKNAARMLNRRIITMYSVSHSTLKADKNSGKSYLLSPSLLNNKWDIFSDTLSEKSFGIALDCGEPPYSDFGDRYGKRQQSVKYETEMLEKMSGTVKTAAVKPTAYQLRFLKTAFELGGECADYDVEDYQIPFYQLAAGKLGYTSSAINIGGNSDGAFKKCLEYGATPMFSIVTNDTEKTAISENGGLYNCFSEQLFTPICEYAKAAKEFYSETGHTLISHRRLEKDVYLSEYNNKCAVFNYSEKNYCCFGITVKPGEFAVIDKEMIR